MASKDQRNEAERQPRELLVKRAMSIKALRRVSLLLAASSIYAPSVVHGQTAPADYLSATRYDLLGRVTGTIAPDPDGSGPLAYAASRSTFDAGGRLVKVETGQLASWQSEGVQPSAWGSAFTVLSSLETTYDGLDRKTRVVTKGSDGVIVSVTQFSYDGVGRLECTAVRMNPAQFGTLPASACTLGTAGSSGADRIIKTRYDDAGQVVQVRKAVGTSIEIADATYTYTDNGKRKFVIDANGNRAELRYDGHDRQARWVFASTTRPTAYNPSTTTTAVSSAGSLNEGDYEAYTYDSNGNRTSLRKRDGSTLSYNYDALNRMTSKIVPERAGLGSTHTRDVYYGYDARGLQAYARFDSGSGEGLTSGYDGLGRLTTATVNLDGQSRQLGYTYDKDGNRTQITWPDGVSLTTSFDKLDRQSSLSNATPTTLAAWTYNARGLPSSVSRSGAAFDQSAGYDPVGRLSSLAISDGSAGSQVSWGYTRNPAGQIATDTRTNDAYAWPGHVNVDRNYTTNGLNQYTAAGSASFCYDANGNLTADGSSVYLYDVENRLVEKRAQANTACASLSYGGALQASLRYDPLGRLYGMASGSATTRFLYDGDALVAEYNAAGTLLRRYGHGNDVGADDPLVWFEGASTLSSNARYVYGDPRGSIVLVGDAAGNAVAINSYDEYGIPAATNQGRFQYTGQAWLAEIGMYHYKARIYSPTLGRFLQTDPIGYDDQVNLYGYVGNDPINGTDPTGLSGRGDATTCGGSPCYSIPGESLARPQVLSGKLRTTEQVDSYWKVRCDEGDPVGCLAPNFRWDGHATGLPAVSRAVLLGDLRNKHGIFKYIPNDMGKSSRTMIGWDEKAVKRDWNRIRIDLANAHKSALAHDLNGLLSARQITFYHWDVYSRYGIGRGSFGGTFGLGREWQISVLAGFWCGAGSRGCD